MRIYVYIYLSNKWMVVVLSSFPMPYSVFLLKKEVWKKEWDESEKKKRYKQSHKLGELRAKKIFWAPKISVFWISPLGMEWESERTKKNHIHIDTTRTIQTEPGHVMPFHFISSGRGSESKHGVWEKKCW